MERNTIQEMKAVLDAMEQGKEVQYQQIGTNDWEKYAGKTPNFFSFRYRIKPETEETLLTYRELNRWLAQGNGEASKDAWRDVITYLDYIKEKENEPVDDCLRIRKWEDTEWHKPTREYAFGEDA